MRRPYNAAPPTGPTIGSTLLDHTPFAPAVWPARPTGRCPTDIGQGEQHESGTGTLLSFYRRWDRYQTLLTQAIAPLSAEHLALSAAPALRPAWVLAAHIIAARVYRFHPVLGEGLPDL